MQTCTAAPLASHGFYLACSAGLSAWRLSDRVKPTESVYYADACEYCTAHGIVTYDSLATWRLNGK